MRFSFGLLRLQPLGRDGILLPKQQHLLVSDPEEPSRYFPDLDPGTWALGGHWRTLDVFQVLSPIQSQQYPLDGDQPVARLLHIYIERERERGQHSLRTKAGTRPGLV